MFPLSLYTIAARKITSMVLLSNTMVLLFLSQARSVPWTGCTMDPLLIYVYVGFSPLTQGCLTWVGQTVREKNIPFFSTLVSGPAEPLK